ncbi:unnamed protein product [Arctogadus glacialis]
MLGRLRPGGSDAAQRSAQDAVFQLGCWQLQGLVHRTSPQAHIRQDTLFLTPAPLLRVPLQPALASTSLNQCIFPLGDLRIWLASACSVMSADAAPDADVPSGVGASASGRGLRSSVLQGCGEGTCSSVLDRVTRMGQRA